MSLLGIRSYQDWNYLLTFTIEKNTIHLGGSTHEFFLEMLETTFVVPVSHENGINWVVKVFRRRPEDCQRPQHAIAILQRVMTVIPGCSILPGRKFVGKMISWRDRALGNRIDTVMFKAVQHSDTMPMNCSAVKFKVIDHFDLWKKSMNVTKVRGAIAVPLPTSSPQHASRSKLSVNADKFPAYKTHESRDQGMFRWTLCHHSYLLRQRWLSCSQHTERTTKGQLPWFHV